MLESKIAEKQLAMKPRTSEIVYTFATAYFGEGVLSVEISQWVFLKSCIVGFVLQGVLVSEIQMWGKCQKVKHKVGADHVSPCHTV